MSQHSYVLFSSLAAAGFAILAVWAFRSGGRARLWAMWTGATVTLAAVAIVYASRSAVGETPASAYLLVTTVPTFAATAFVDFVGRREHPIAVQFVGAGVICWVLMPGMLLLGTYGFGQ